MESFEHGIKANLMTVTSQVQFVIWTMYTMIRN